MQNTSKKEKLVRITARMPASKRDEAEAVAEGLGFDLSTAINIFVTQMIRTNSIPFKLVSSNVSELDIALAEAKAGQIDRFTSKKDFYHYLDKIAASVKDDDADD